MRSRTRGIPALIGATIASLALAGGVLAAETALSADLASTLR